MHMKSELLALREAMKNHSVDIYLIPTGDFHGSEYIHDYFKTREFVSGFTGSAGTLVVTQDDARLWTDGRYFLQAAFELEGSGIQLMKDKEPGVPSINEYLEEVLGKTENPVIGFDGRIVSCQDGREYAQLANEYGGSIISEIDLAGDIWSDRPELKGKTIWELPLTSAGLPYETKIKQVRELMAKSDAEYHLITTLDDNGWLYNLRGSDVEHTPVFFSYTLITPEETVLYIFDEMCPEGLIPDGVIVKPYFSEDGGLSVMDDLKVIPDEATVLLDPKSASYSMVSSIPENVTLAEADFIPSTRLKACKNPVEIQSTKEAHINDGIAMVNFIHWLKSSIAEWSEGTASDDMTEIGVATYLEGERSKQPGYLDLSFDTIAGYMEHGAIVHYGATPETNAKLRPEGFLLVDSGGQYQGGTTDITRTIALGPLSDRMRESYTAVLRGHLRLAMAKFAKGTTGKDLDVIAKAPLDEYGISYNHGTGHGVGHVLCVHEGPNRINTISEEPIIPGMITSDEPGYYPEGEFGVRIENEILCILGKDNPEEGYEFEMLTCCPYERDAIVPEMMTEEEKAYLNDYHKWVYESLAPSLSPEVADWLKDVCADIN